MQNSQFQGLVKLVVVMLLGMGSFLLHAWLRTSVVTSSYQVGESRKKMLRLENDLASLSSLKESLMNASALHALKDKWADRGEFFVEASPAQVLFLKEPEIEGGSYDGL